MGRSNVMCTRVWQQRLQSKFPILCQLLDPRSMTPDWSSDPLSSRVITLSNGIWTTHERPQMCSLECDGSTTNHYSPMGRFWSPYEVDAQLSQESDIFVQCSAFRQATDQGQKSALETGRYFNRPYTHSCTTHPYTTPTQIQTNTDKVNSHQIGHRIQEVCILQIKR